MLFLVAAKIAQCVLVLLAFAAGFALALASIPVWLKAVVALGPFVSALWICFWFPIADEAQGR